MRPDVRPLTVATLSVAALSLLAAAFTTAAQAQPAPRPNFVVILADDLGWGDISANGADLIDTPNIDRLAREGARLTSFYAAANVCTPSRAALLTGRYPIRSGMQHVVRPHSDWGLPAAELTLPEALKSAGYATGMIGKWHLGHRDEYWPTAHGFDSFFGVAYSNDMQPFDLYRDKEAVQSPADQTTLTDRYAAEASAFIAAHRDEPFFLYVAETFPHLPLHAPEDALGTSDAGLYGDVVEHLDRGVGAIIDALAENGVLDRTLVIVTSDNGPWFEGDPGPYRGRKGGSYEGGYRVPFVARWPERIPAGHVSDAMAMSIDLWPTLLGLAGAERPGDLVIDGADIAPLLFGGDATPHSVLFFFDGNDVAAVRDPRFKLTLRDFYRTFEVPFERYGHPLLFDLRADPAERFDFSPAYPEALARLKADVEAMRQETADLRKDPPSLRPESPDMPLGPVFAKASEDPVPREPGSD